MFVGTPPMYEHIMSNIERHKMKRTFYYHILPGGIREKANFTNTQVYFICKIISK